MSILTKIFPPKIERKKKKCRKEIGRQNDLIKLEKNTIISNLEHIEYNIKNKNTSVSLINKFCIPINDRIKQEIHRISNKQIREKIKSKYDLELKKINNFTNKALKDRFTFYKNIINYSANLRYDDVFDNHKQVSELHLSELRLEFLKTKLKFLENVNKPKIHNLAKISNQ